MYAPNINNKGCAHNHLSFWSYVLVYVGRSNCQQLANDSIQEIKYPRSVMNDIKYVWQQTDDCSGYTEDNGRPAECLR